MDPENPVVRLCVLGMQAEGEGRKAEAKALFQRAWAERKDDYEACIAAHYVARHEESELAVLAWNERALELADRVGDDRVRGFYPSLLFCVGRSHDVLGNRVEARGYYDRAAARLDDLPPGPYADFVRNAVTRARSTPG